MATRTGKKNQPQATRVVAYCRVSTDKQVDGGVSLEDQQKKVAAYATLHDLTLVRVVVDAGVSAKDLARPGLQEALGMLRTGAADALLVVKLDRLTRSVKDLGHLVEEHFSTSALISVSENIDTRSAAGRLVLNVLASVSQWEREAVSERTASAMQHKASQAEYTGGMAPYGFCLSADQVHLVRNEDEQRSIALLKDLRSQGLTVRQVAAEATKQGCLNRKNKPFALAQIQKILTNNPIAA